MWSSSLQVINLWTMGAHILHLPSAISSLSHLHILHLPSTTSSLSHLHISNSIHLSTSSAQRASSRSSGSTFTPPHLHTSTPQAHRGPPREAPARRFSSAPPPGGAGAASPQPASEGGQRPLDLDLDLDLNTRLQEEREQRPLDLHTCLWSPLGNLSDSFLREADSTSERAGRTVWGKERAVQCVVNGSTGLRGGRH